MGCGCGKKASRPAARATVVSRNTSTSKLNAAKTYQSATMRKPTTSSTRKTV